MANNMSSRQACHAARYVVARVLRGLFWCLKYTVILPLATMALMALFVLWKDNTTPGKLLVPGYVWSECYSRFRGWRD